MQFLEDKSLLFKLFYWIHKVVTTWYISEIILALFIMLALAFMLVIGVNHKLFRFLIKDRLKFVIHYLNCYILQKINFIKDFLYVIRFNYKKVLVIVFLAFLILGLILWILISFTQRTA